MKTLVPGRITAVLFFLFLILACEKNEVEIATGEEDKSAELIIKSLVEEAGNRYLNSEDVLAENNDDVISERKSLIDEYTADNTGFTDIRNRNSLLICVRSVEPDRDQRQKLSRILTDYSERNKRIIDAHHEQMRNVQQRIMAARNQLHKSMEAGEINREQYRQRMQMLRDRYQESVNRIKSSNIEAFSRSYALMLEHLRQIFSLEQWNSFISCMLS